MSLLSEKTVLVAGGAGGVGEGITRQLLLAGAKVVVLQEVKRRQRSFVIDSLTTATSQQ